MYKGYGIARARVSQGRFDDFLQRRAQARKIRRFCETRQISLIMKTPFFYSFETETVSAMSLWRMGWIDFVVITSRDCIEGIIDEAIREALFELDAKNSLLILDEMRFF